ncbi:MAG TPA: hypothetical protein VKV40_16835 [Ktedonobacteraceae bacterium]|nr:hypothetical protein [Ktedonobacteraceae bacterium]
MAQPFVVIGTFADLERATREVCAQIDELVRHIPDEEAHVYARLAKENLWKMLQTSHKRALAREGFGQ